MEKMSAKFSLIIYYLTISGEFTVLEDRTKLRLCGMKSIVSWPLLKKECIKYYEDKKRDIQAIKICDSVYLINLVYIKDIPFIVASKRDMRSIKGKNFKEVTMEE